MPVVLIRYNTVISKGLHFVSVDDNKKLDLFYFNEFIFFSFLFVCTIIKLVLDTNC